MKREIFGSSNIFPFLEFFRLNHKKKKKKKSKETKIRFTIFISQRMFFPKKKNDNELRETSTHIGKTMVILGIDTPKLP